MSSREQDIVVERLSEQHGNVCVKEGYADHTVEATVPNGANFRITSGGVLLDAGVNFSIDWTQ